MMSARLVAAAVDELWKCQTHLVEHVGTEKDLECIIYDKRILQTVWLSVAHVEWTDHKYPW